jgi:uncharacterized protein YpmB|tara:strand:- start:188 stop:382 length:195 start_codon:yes stop_codon:yes gene_type:complete
MEENKEGNKNQILIGVLAVIFFVIYLVYSSYETDRIMDRSFKESEKIMKDAQREVDDMMRDYNY